MKVLKLAIYLLSLSALVGACSQADKTQCECLSQAQKVNRLSTKIWSAKATQQDSILLKEALIKKEKLCKSLQESAPEALHQLKSTCQQ